MLASGGHILENEALMVNAVMMGKGIKHLK
jgi:hypothetical protein